jgi:hypothetical protein
MENKESKLDLVSLSDSLDTALKNETKESLTEWLESGRKETTTQYCNHDFVIKYGGYECQNCGIEYDEINKLN